MLSLHLVKTLISQIVRGSYIRIIGIFKLNLISVISSCINLHIKKYIPHLYLMYRMLTFFLLYTDRVLAKFGLHEHGQRLNL